MVQAIDESMWVIPLVISLLLAISVIGKLILDETLGMINLIALLLSSWYTYQIHGLYKELKKKRNK